MAILPLLVIWVSALLVTPALSGNKFCERTYFWSPDGGRVDSAPDWSSTRFKKGPCLHVSGIGATQTYKKTVILVDRTNAVSTYLKLPNSGEPAFAEEVDMGGSRWKYRGLNVQTNTFCSTGQHVAGGGLLTIGGHQTGLGSGNYDDPARSRRLLGLNSTSHRRSVISGGGGFSVRLFEPCNDRRCDFALVDKLKERRWYPTSQLLGDGRVIIVGGSKTAVGVNRPELNVPSVEYYPRKRNEGTHRIQFLEDTLPFNLYPIVHLLPNGLVFIFSGTSYILWDTSKNKVAKDRNPRLNAYLGGDEVQVVNPIAGTTAMFPLKYSSDWTAEIIICGGAPSEAVKSNQLKADNRCWRIRPLDRKPRWRQESMRYARVMPLGVLLPDGNLLIHGGSQYGHSGFPNTARQPVLYPELFSTRTRTWSRDDLGVSRIVRLYHASGFLLHDGSVFFSGSNPNANDKRITRTVSGDNFPTEFRTEIYQPPYLLSDRPRPRITSAPKEMRSRTSYSITFTYSGRFDEVAVVLAQPGFSTHGFNHGMRNVELEVRSVSPQGGSFVVLAKGPPDLNTCPPTWYWLFVVVDGIPSREGLYVFVV